VERRIRCENLQRVPTPGRPASRRNEWIGRDNDLLMTAGVGGAETIDLLWTTRPLPSLYSIKDTGLPRLIYIYILNNDSAASNDRGISITYVEYGRGRTLVYSRESLGETKIRSALADQEPRPVNAPCITFLCCFRPVGQRPYTRYVRNM